MDVSIRCVFKVNGCVHEKAFINIKHKVSEYTREGDWISQKSYSFFVISLTAFLKREFRCLKCASLQPSQTLVC